MLQDTQGEGFDEVEAIDPLGVLQRVRAVNTEFLFPAICRYADSLDKDLLNELSSDLKKHYGHFFHDMGAELLTAQHLIRELADIKTADRIHTVDDIEAQLDHMLANWTGTEPRDTDNARERSAIELSWCVSALTQIQVPLMDLFDGVGDESLSLIELAKDGLTPRRTVHDPNVFIRIENVWRTVLGLTLNYFERKAAALAILGRTSDWSPQRVTHILSSEAMDRAWSCMEQADPTVVQHLHSAALDALRICVSRALQGHESRELGSLTLRFFVELLSEANVDLPVDEAIFFRTVLLLGDMQMVGYRIAPADMYCLLRYFDDRIRKLVKWMPSQEELDRIARGYHKMIVNSEESGDEPKS